MARASFLPDWDDDDEQAATRLDAAPFALEDWRSVAANRSPPPRLGLVPAARRAPAPTGPSLDAPPSSPARHDSFIRTREAPAASVVDAFLDEAEDDLLTLGVNLACLEDPTAGVPAWDLSARAAAASLRARVLELSSVKDALAEVLADAAATPRLGALLGPDASLSAYLKGLFLWTLGVTGALAELGAGLRALGPDWTALRARLADASDWYFDELPHEIRTDLARAGLVGSEAEEHLEELYFAAAHLAAGLAKRFG